MFRRKKEEKSGSFTPSIGEKEFEPSPGELIEVDPTLKLGWKDKPQFEYELIKCPLSCIDFTPTNGFFIKEIGNKDKIFIEGYQKKLDEGYKIHSFNISGSHVYFLLEHAS